MSDNPRPISPDHINFGRALVALAREHGAGSLNVTFKLSSSARFRDRTENWTQVHLTWAEGRHGAEGNFTLRAEAHESFKEKVSDGECAVSPTGRHQVDTSMESGPNNCFYCERPMPRGQ